ncbi:MAG: FAD-dependent oxidoreductase, partial [Thiotrichales bacterium]|nr:FAD-dependent oxidoreductase [Thiotrichales bacterium]
DVGKDISTDELQDIFDAVIFTTGATKARDLPAENRDAKGIYPAMDYLTSNTKSLLDNGIPDESELSAKGKNVIVIGGGDTGTDCIGTSLRQGAKSIINFELMSQPPGQRSDSNPWPEWPVIFRVDYGHEESNKVFGKDPRRYQLLTKAFIKDSNGHVKGIKTTNVDFVDGKLTEVDGTEKTWDAELVLLSMGFLSPEHYLSEDANIELDERGNYQSKHGEFNTSRNGIFSAGDCRRGQSLVVWAINEGRGVANSVNDFLLNS